MRYYNEAKVERSIRRKSIGITFTILFLMGTATAVLVSKNSKDYFPEFIKEWFEKAPVENPKAVKERA